MRIAAPAPRGAPAARARPPSPPPASRPPRVVFLDALQPDNPWRRELVGGYGVHGQVRGLFGQGAGVAVAGRFSLEWARYVEGGTGTSPKSLMTRGAFWAGYQATGVFLEANAGFQGTQPRWGVTAGVSFRVPATLGFGLPDTDKLRQLDWVKKVNARREQKR